MTGTFRYVAILISLFMLWPIRSQAIDRDVGKLEKKTVFPPPFSPELIRRQSERVKRSKIDKLIEILKIKPGMTILDIGTGSGQYAYKFAEKLKGTGKVFATDINSNMVNYVNNEAYRKGLANLYPVLVKKEGVDEFYGKHKYDLIFLAYVYPYLQNRIDYLKNISNFLAKDGRFVVIGYKIFPDFSLDDFTDFDGLARELSGEAVNSPFYKYLDKSTQELIIQKNRNKINELLKNAIVSDFNKLLASPYFCSDFLKDGLIFKEGVFFSSEEKIFANYLVHFLQKELGVFDTAGTFLGNLDDRDIALIKMLNRLLIIQRFRRYLCKDEQSRVFTRKQSFGKQEIKRTFEEAGYKLEKEYSLQPFEVILVFRSNKDTDGQ